MAWCLKVQDTGCVNMVMSWLEFRGLSSLRDWGESGLRSVGFGLGLRGLGV